MKNQEAVSTAWLTRSQAGGGRYGAGHPALSIAKIPASSRSTKLGLSRILVALTHKCCR